MLGVHSIKPPGTLGGLDVFFIQGNRCKSPPIGCEKANPSYRSQLIDHVITSRKAGYFFAGTWLLHRTTCVRQSKALVMVVTLAWPVLADFGPEGRPNAT